MDMATINIKHMVKSREKMPNALPATGLLTNQGKAYLPRKKQPTTLIAASKAAYTKPPISPELSPSAKKFAFNMPSTTTRNTSKE